MNRKYAEVLDRVARESLSRSRDLTPRILSQIEKGRNLRMLSRMKLVPIAIAAFLFALIVFVRAPAVAAAVQRWLGYVPRVGLVHDGKVRVLAEPVSITRDGVTLTIKQVVVDSERTTVIYAVEGLQPELLDSYPGANMRGCYEASALRWASGELHQDGVVGKSWVTGYEDRAAYPVVPANIEEVTLTLPCLRSVLPGSAPDSWALPFRLTPARAKVTILPVIEIAAPQAAATPAPQLSAHAIPTDLVSLTLDHAVQTADGYLIYATLHWENTGLYSLNVPDPANLHLTDAHGRLLPWEFDEDAAMSLTPPRGQTAFVLRIRQLEDAGALTLTIDALSVEVAGGGSFTFDPGANPKPGEVRNLNEMVDLGHGLSMRVLKVMYPLPPRPDLPQPAGLSFEMESSTGVTSAILSDRERPLLASSGGADGLVPGRFRATLAYPAGLPQGPIQVDVKSFWVEMPGYWEASWTPPARLP